MQKFTKLFLLIILTQQALGLQIYNGDEFEKHRDSVNSQDIVVLGPEPISLKTSLSITAEKVMISGEILTNGFDLTIVARWVEFTPESRVIAFKGAAGEMELNRQKLLAESRAAQEVAGKDGRDGLTGLAGLAGYPVPGPIRIFAGAIINPPIIDATGQTGEKAGRGQEAQDGQPGGQGHKAKRNGSGLWHDRGPGQGARGGRGGRGGDGGEGGEGGAPAPIELHYGQYFTRSLKDGSLELADVSVKKEDWIIVAKPGKGGAGGDGGKNGKAGPGGPGGDGESSIWKGSGTRGSGPSGTNRDYVANTGRTGKAYDGSIVVNISNSFAGVTARYLESELLIEVVNIGREVDERLRDVERLATDPNPQAKTEFEKNMTVLRTRIERTGTNYKWLLSDLGSDPNRQAIFELAQANGAALEAVKKLAETNDKSQVNLKAVTAAKAASEKSLREEHTKAIEAMKNIAREILKLKDHVYYEGPNLPALSAYRIFGPIELENWVFGGNVAGSRDPLKPVAPMETRIFGGLEEYKISVGKSIGDESPLIQGDLYHELP